MKRPTFEIHRGLSLIELMLALSISAMVAAAIAGMLGAVSTGVGTRKDNRAIMVLSNNAQSRLGAYFAPALCLLEVDGANSVLWFSDSRQSDSVHATEIRWLEFDASAGMLNVSFVDFPEAWSQADCDLEDHEYAKDADWDDVLAHYRGNGWIATRALVDRLASVSVTTDEPTAMASRHILFGLGFETDAGVMPTTAAVTIRVHKAPTK